MRQFWLDITADASKLAPFLVSCLALLVSIASFAFNWFHANRLMRVSRFPFLRISAEVSTRHGAVQKEGGTPYLVLELRNMTQVPAIDGAVEIVTWKAFHSVRWTIEPQSWREIPSKESRKADDLPTLGESSTLAAAIVQLSGEAITPHYTPLLTGFAMLDGLTTNVDRPARFVVIVGVSWHQADYGAATFAYKRAYRLTAQIVGPNIMSWRLEALGRFGLWLARLGGSDTPRLLPDSVPNDRLERIGV